MTNKCSCAIITLPHYEFMCRAVRKGAVGREDFAQIFVLYAVGTNTDKRFAHAYPREELPSFAIGLLKNIVTIATGVEIVKKERFRRGFCCDTIFS